MPLTHYHRKRRAHPRTTQLQRNNSVAGLSHPRWRTKPTTKKRAPTKKAPAKRRRARR
jgi:hypothetical protein